jgi:exonuclease SbcD
MVLMKLLHTADWHIGQTFFDYDRKMEHLQFLEWLRKQVRELSVDVLLVAGDLFDSPNPSAESQKIYYHFLRDITAENPDLQIIIIAGNHDSAARLEAPNPLLEAMNITVRGIVKRTETGEIDFEYLIIPLNKGGYCLAAPYLRQGDYPEAGVYAEGVQAMYKTLFDKVKDKNKPVIAMGHLQATGSEISENDRAERTVIGGLDCISPEAFDENIAYTALGHLHRAQRVSGRENVRYSGAPLPMSFAEKNNKQGVTLVTISDKTEIERLEFDAPVKLLSLPQTPLPLSETIAEIEKLPDGEISETSPFLEIKVLITEPEPSLRIKIEKALAGKAVRLARIEASMQRNERKEQVISYEELQKINPLDMAIDIFRRKYGGDEMPEHIKNLLQSVIREVEI